MEIKGRVFENSGVEIKLKQFLHGVKKPKVILLEIFITVIIAGSSR